MNDDLQCLVDALGAALRRPVCVDDARFRLVSYKEHDLEEVDSVRVAKLMHRQADANVQAWLEEHGARTADTYARIPRNPELDMARRILVPLRFDGLLLGWLALIDEPEPITEAELGEALRYSKDLSVALFQQYRLHQDERRPEIAVVRQLLGLASGSSEASQDEITAQGFLAMTAGYTCLVAKASAESDAPLPPAARVGIAALMEWTRRLVPAHHVISVSAGDEAIAVLAVARPTDLDSVASALSKHLGDSLLDHPGVEAVVGVGGVVSTVRELKTSLEQARSAARVARRVDGHSPLAKWSELGSYRTVANLLAT